MKITIGENVNQPVLTAYIPHEAEVLLKDRPGFSQLQAQISSPEHRKDISVQQDNDYTSYSLMASRIGRRAATQRGHYLRPFVRLLEWGQIANTHIEPTPVKIVDIDTNPAMDGFYNLETEVMWPTDEAKIVSDLATTAMHKFGRRLAYGSYRQPDLYTQQVYARVEGTGTPTHSREAQFNSVSSRSVIINTAISDRDLSYETRPADGPTPAFTMLGNHLRSRQELLIHLVGAAAIGWAGHLVKE